MATNQKETTPHPMTKEQIFTKATVDWGITNDAVKERIAVFIDQQSQHHAARVENTDGFKYIESLLSDKSDNHNVIHVEGNNDLFISSTEAINALKIQAGQSEDRIDKLELLFRNFIRQEHLTAKWEEYLIATDALREEGEK